jgi:hypothetical protein
LNRVDIQAPADRTFETGCWQIAAGDVTICYHSLTGLDIIPFLSAQLGNFVGLREHSVNLKFPNLALDVEKVGLEMKLTDSATIQVRSSSVSYRDRSLMFSSIVLELNEIDVLGLSKSAVSVSDQGVLAIDVQGLRFKDRHQLSIEDFLMQTLAAWRAVAPYVVRDHSLMESLPFPIRVAISRVSWKFYDSAVSASLSRASRLMPANLSDSYVREFLMTKKIKERGPPGQAKSELMRRLKALQFREYREQLNSVRAHKCNIALIFTDAAVTLDSRGFADKLAVIHQLDPTLRELYPDLQWEAVNGFHVGAECASFSIHAFDVATPILEARRLRIVGPLILAEPKAPEAFDMAPRICGRTFPALKNPMKLRIWTDLSVSGDTFYYYFGICYQAIYQELMIMFAQVFPYGVDPSVRLAWFDLLRGQFRGQMLFNFRDWELRMPGSSSYRDCGNYLGVKVERFRLFTREGDWSFSCGGLTCPRVYAGVTGPVLVELATTEVRMKFHWESKVGDARRFIGFPDISKFAAPGYDTHAGFRCFTVVIDEATASFNKSDRITPTVTLDVAHLDWCLRPLLIFGESAGKKGQIAKKLGFKTIVRMPRKYLNEVDRIGSARILVTHFLVRVYDTFPIREDHKTPWFSFDCNFTDIQAALRFSLTHTEKVFCTKAHIGAMSLTATNLDRSAVGFRRTPPTFLIVQPLDIDTGERNEFVLDDVALTVNPLILGYVLGFVKSILTMPFIKKVPGPFQEAKASDFPQVKNTIVAHTVRAALRSLESDITIRATARDAQAVQSLNDSASAWQASADEVRASIGDENCLLMVRPSFFSATRTSIIALETIEAELTPERLGAARFLSQEFTKDDSAADTGERNPKKVSVTVQNIKCTVSAPPIAIEANATNVIGVLLRQVDETVDISLRVMNSSLKNLGRDGFADIFTRKQQGSGRGAVHPQFLIRLRMPPKVSAHYVFSQAEVNIDPAVLSYDTRLWDTLKAKFRVEFVPKAASVGPDIRETRHQFVFLDANCFPAGPARENAAAPRSGADQLKFAKEDIEGTMMFRYFRLNAVMMDFSYKNPENKILSEIHNFQSQIHEIIYHDLSANLPELIGKVVTDIAYMMIPQFLKHCVGLKRPDLTPEQPIAAWLNTEDQRMTVKDKQKMLLFGPGERK